MPVPGVKICPECRGLLPYVKEPACRRCGKELADSRLEYCGDCVKRKRSFARGFGLLNYTELMSGSMSAIKYKHRKEYLDFYAEECAARCGPELLGLEPDCLIPVPVHPSRLRTRGFNQAEVFAVKLGGLLGIPVVTDFLLRVRRTAPQKELDPEERLRNLTRAFAAAGPAPEGVRRVILVDDIYTTGSTAEACTRALLGAGAQQVFIFVICVGHGQ